MHACTGAHSNVEVCRKLVAFGGFKYPESDEKKARETKERLENPKMPELPGIDERLSKIMFERLLCATSRHGYDPGKHCRRLTSELLCATSD